jgi:hypothetical protein
MPQLQCTSRPRTHTILHKKIVMSRESFVADGITGLCDSALESQQEQEQPRGAHTAGSSVNAVLIQSPLTGFSIPSRRPPQGVPSAANASATWCKMLVRTVTSGEQHESRCRVNASKY